MCLPVKLTLKAIEDHLKEENGDEENPQLLSICFLCYCFNKEWFKTFYHYKPEIQESIRKQIDQELKESYRDQLKKQLEIIEKEVCHFIFLTKNKIKPHNFYVFLKKHPKKKQKLEKLLEEAQ